MDQTDEPTFRIQFRRQPYFLFDQAWKKLVLLVAILESGKHKPSVDLIVRITQVFDVSFDQLMDDEIVLTIKEPVDEAVMARKKVPVKIQRQFIDEIKNDVIKGKI